jgi:outer membrane protein OmpA-like peptidoglycan-associated protein
MYKFHFRTSDERSTFVHRENETLVTNVKTYTTYIRKTEEIYHYSLIDTLLAYSQQNVDTPEMQAKKDSIRALIDADKNRGKRAADGMPLDSILLKNLLPYEMVFFELDRWEILPTEEMKIDKMARIMKAYPNETFILTGSADSKTGTVNRNIFLSHHRADTVYTTLVEKYGINPSQLKREYLGGILEYKPFQLNRTTVIIMDHPAVRRAFEEMKKEGQAGGGEVEIKD